MKKTFKYRIKTNKKILTDTDEVLNLCRVLYNLCLEQRINAWKYHKKSISCYDQIKQLTSRPE
ncbi:MAG TPA: helix-turn-helix domain-containing protein, partial [Candidatus Ratteibacteria bacterium]|nr:helix-turn-helix domain-containing protein [Candidatus Ratteibacteria bacterium]